MAIFGAGHTFLAMHGLDARVLSMAAAGFGVKNPRHDVGGFVTNVGITFELKELIPWGESRVALGYADGYSRPQPVPLHVAAWLFRAQMNHVAGRK